MKLIYDKIDNIPIWKHLKDNGSNGYDAEMTAGDYGVVAERIGTRLLSIGIKHKSLIGVFYPNIEVLSIKKLHGNGDYLIEISYKNHNGYGKKILLFEIKHGRIDISQA